MVKVFIKTYGCSFNQADSQIIKGNLIKQGYKISQNDVDANLIIINSCSVKNMSETKFFRDIKKYSKEGKKIIAAGCIPQAEISYLNTKLKDISIIGTNNLSQIGEVVEKTLNGEVCHKIEKTIFKKIDENQRLIIQQSRFDISKVTNNNFIEIIPINEGCLNFCTYCKTKYARGNLLSYPIDTIKKIMKKAIERKAKEIYLTSQDTACYGFDINTNLAELLKELLKIEGDYKIRIGMGNPNHFKNIIDEILEIMKKDNRIYKFLHIPIQSGNNRILKEMRRGYTKEDYDMIIEKCHKFDEKITIANDIIVAYPTETFEEFEDTIKSMIKSKINVLNFSRFWLRPNTPCENIYTSKDFIEGKESKRRVAILKKEFEKMAYNQNKEWIGWTGQVTIVEYGKKNTKSYIARNDYYKPIIVKTDKKLQIGQKVNIKITDVTWYDFRSELI